MDTLFFTQKKYLFLQKQVLITVKISPYFSKISNYFHNNEDSGSSGNSATFGNVHETMYEYTITTLTKCSTEQSNTYKTILYSTVV